MPAARAAQGSFGDVGSVGARPEGAPKGKDAYAAANFASMGDTSEYVDRESVADVITCLASSLARNVSG